DSLRKLQQPVSKAADCLVEFGGIERPKVDQPLHAAVPQFPGGDRAYAPERVDRQLLQERLDAIGADDGEPVWLLPTRSNLREELVRGHTCRSREAGVREDPLLETLRDAGRQRLVPGILGDIQVRFIERQRLD